MSEIITRNYITWYTPGSFFPEEVTQEVPNFTIPIEIPSDVYAFRFHSTEFVLNKGKEYRGDTTRQPKLYFIGIAVPVDSIPNTGEFDILKTNIKCNSPTKEGLLTIQLNWQYVGEEMVLIRPDEVKFIAPLIYEKQTPERTQQAALKLLSGDIFSKAS